MKNIHIFSESAAIGRRLRDILYQAGYAEIAVSDLSAISAERQDEIIIIYAKSRIPEIIRNAADSGCQTVLLLNPDCYALHLERARHAGIRLLLMPVVPYLLLDAVREMTAIS